MRPVAAAFSGSIGSGKSSLALAVGERTGWRVVGFGDYVRSVAISQGKGIERAVLQEIGESLIAANCDEFCRRVLEQKEWLPGTPILIEGIRHAQALDALRRIVAPLDLVHIHVEVSADLQAQRLQAREPNIVANLGALQAHSTEAQVKSVLPSIANLVLAGDRPVAELAESVVAHLAGR